MLPPQLLDGGIRGGTFDTAVPAQIVVCAIAVLFTVGLVMFAVIGHKIIKCEAIVGRDIVDAAAGKPLMVLKKICTPHDVVG